MLKLLLLHATNLLKCSLSQRALNTVHRTPNTEHILITFYLAILTPDMQVATEGGRVPLAEQLVRSRRACAAGGRIEELM